MIEDFPVLVVIVTVHFRFRVNEQISDFGFIVSDFPLSLAKRVSGLKRRQLTNS